MNLRNWFEELRHAPVKKALPILSFPSAQLLGVSVRQLISDSGMQAEGMIRIAARTDALAAVSLMDLSVEAECYGSQIRFSENEVPTVRGRVISTLEEALELSEPEVGSARSGIYLDAVRQAKAKISDRPVFAGMIGPFSLAGRLMDVSETMVHCYEAPELVHMLMEKVSDFLVSYGAAYRKAGADGILMAEPLTGMLSPALAREFSAPYVKKIVNLLQSDDFGIIYHNCGDNTLQMADSIASLGAMAYHFGNSISMKEMLERFPAEYPVMGNLDPAGILKNGTPEQVRQATLELMTDCGRYENFIPSSGCDIPPQTPWENIDAFLAAVAEAQK